MKSAPLVALGVFISAIIVGSHFLYQSYKFDDDIAPGLDGFKGFGVEGCVSTMFPGIRSMDDENIPAATGSDKIDSNLFDGAEGDSQGCLVINGNRVTVTDASNKKQGKGNFRFLWAMKRGSKGFINFTKASIMGNDAQKVNGEGVAYMTEMDANKKTWSIKKKKEIKDKAMSKEDIDSKFPKVGEVLPKFEAGSYFGLMKESEKDKICADNICLDTGDIKSSEFKGYGTWKHSDKGKESHKWVNNMSEFWRVTYGEEAGDMVEASKSLKGTWVNQRFVGLKPVVSAT